MGVRQRNREGGSLDKAEILPSQMTRSRVGSQANPIQSNFRRVTGGHPPFFEFSCPPMPACAAGVRGRGRASKPAIFARVAGSTGTELFCAPRERYAGLQPRTTTLGELLLLVQSLRLGTRSRLPNWNRLLNRTMPNREQQEFPITYPFTGVQGLVNGVFPKK
jgi:hypothetical protein